MSQPVLSLPKGWVYYWFASCMKSIRKHRAKYVLDAEPEKMDIVTIKTQAQHFQRSEWIRDSATNERVLYEYTPPSGSTGTDHVEIETCT